MKDSAIDYNKERRVFHDIIGCSYDVYNEYRHGLTEYPYQYGLKHLLRKLNYDVQKEYELPLYLFNEKLEEHYRCDLVLVRAEGNVIIECKAVKFVSEEHRDQLKNYMLLTHCPYGVLINFCKTKHQVYTEVYHYDERFHRVDPFDIKYQGQVNEPMNKPWQKFLDERKQSREIYYHHIEIKK